RSYWVNCVVTVSRKHILKLAFNNVTLLKNTVTRFYHASTTHMCSCSKTVSDEKYQDPFQLGRKDLKNLYEDIKKELLVSTAELREMCEYYFDGKGKAFRPMIVVLMARACNIHHSNSREVQASQRSVAIIAEMIHTASLVHDDVIDDANSRRGKMTVNQIWGERKAVLAGDFILSAASLALARIGNTTIISVLTQVIEDLVRGEFLQLGSKENENERFAHYLEKTFKKTASLIANSCKAVCTSVSSKVNIPYSVGENNHLHILHIIFSKNTSMYMLVCLGPCYILLYLSASSVNSLQKDVIQNDVLIQKTCLVRVQKMEKLSNRPIPIELYVIFNFF
uniref:Decaprenyl diphosphate synthase subunit 1 n=1 Tax=Pavo cristatus TaxID=9049 RepID=A0A8C9FWV9_PAVCR